MHAGAYGDVRMVLAEPNAVVRHGLKSALAAHGFRHVFDTDRFGPAHQELHTNQVDLLVTASELFGGDVPQLIRDLRHMKVGRNPFVVIIVIITSPSIEKVRLFAVSGADDAIASPVAAGHLLARIDAMATARKPFIISGPYVGPDRRAQNREGPQPPTVEAPNLLKLRIDGTEADYLHHVHTAVQRLEMMLGARHK